ncbi:MAG TPA: hypothetical protein PK283_07040, partial [Thiotrichales bacterium]|nr:hypothetical protein [Thiotrichales bacterium]
LNLPQAAKHLTMQAQASIAEDHTPDEDTDVNELLGDGTEPEPQAPETPLTDIDDDDHYLAQAEADALEYAATVVELCALAGLPQKAAGFIKAKASLVDVRAELLKAKAGGQQHLETYQQPAKATALPLAGDIYSKRNKQ